MLLVGLRNHKPKKGRQSSRQCTTPQRENGPGRGWKICALFPRFSHTVPGLWFFGRVPTNAVVAVRSIAALRPRGGLLPAMPFCHQPIITWPGAAEACFIPAEDPGGWILAEAAAAYRPRHPERTGFYQLFETHFDSYVRAYEERFEARSGPLRPVVVRSLEAFLDCGRLQGGFAGIRCPKCRDEHLLAFSCRTRNFCSSCQAKRSVLFAEKLTTEILAPVPHRRWTLSSPRVLRGLVERDRKLLGLLSQTAYAAILKTFQALFERTDVRPGCVVSLQTFGAYGANFNPHAHALVSDGVFSAEGEFLPLPALDTAAVMEVFRRLLLLRLHQAERLAESFMHNLLSWVNPGFSVFAGPPVEAAALTSLESQARYISRPALAMDALQKLDDGRLALETPPPDPRTGATLLALDPLEWIHRAHPRSRAPWPTLLRRLL